MVYWVLKKLFVHYFYVMNLGKVMLEPRNLKYIACNMLDVLQTLLTSSIVGFDFHSKVTVFCIVINTYIIWRVYTDHVT